MEELDIVDVFRELHPNKRAYTYESKALKLKSRIDVFLISHSFISNAEKVEVRSSIVPDHNALFLRLQIDNSIKRGPGTWNFNKLLLGDNDYRLLINELLPIILEKYKDVESKQLLWELIKMEIRSETIKYSKPKRKKLINKENLLQQEIEALDHEICNNVNLNQQLLNKYEAAKNELKEIHDCKGREAIFKSKVRWVEKGEKPTRYFYSLEKRNYERKDITQLKTRNGKITSNKELIRTEVDDFYSDLLKTKLIQTNTPILVTNLMILLTAWKFQD